jgi:sugar diacid utilization regulator
MVDRLARFLEASVVLVSADGRPEIIAGKAPVDELLREVCQQPPGLLELEADGWHAVVTPVATQADRAARRLVLASPRRGFIGKLAKPAAEATAPLLAAMAQLSDVVRDQEQAVKAALLEEALAPADARDPLPLAARAAAFGLDFSRPARLVVIAPRTRRDRPDLAAVRRELVAGLERAAIPHLVHQREASLMALVQGENEQMWPALAGAAGLFPGLVIGVGRPVDGIADAHHSLRDAELAADHSGLDPDRRMMRFEDFDLGTFLVSEVAPERLEPKVDEILSVLRANAPLHEALSAYFAHDLDMATTAASLHMHRNSLRYRLARAEQLLGLSLKQPSAITAVYLALVAEASGQKRAAGLD